MTISQSRLRFQTRFLTQAHSRFHLELGWLCAYVDLRDMSWETPLPSLLEEGGLAADQRTSGPHSVADTD